MLGTMALATPSEPPSRLRRYQITTEVMSQASVAQIITSHVDRRGISRRMATANAMRPILPIAAPAASRPAASLPRIVLSRRVAVFFCFSCFSTRVALAGKIAGNARNKPSTPGPHLLAINPAATVMAPPNANLRAYSYHLVFRELRDPALFSLAYLKAAYQSPKAAAIHMRIDDAVTARGGSSCLRSSRPTRRAKIKNAIAPTIMERASVCA